MPSRDDARPPGEPRWRGFVLRAAVSGALALSLLCGFVLILDPYGRGTSPARAPAPIMDINQRYMYPQLVRSGRFDSAVFGTSTARLLDPRALDAALGGRFANLAINAGTPWEQLQLAGLFLRHVHAPKTLILGLDLSWCDPRADQPDRRVTFRSFPPWLYDDDPLNDLPHLVNFKTLEIAGRVALNRLGLMPERIRGDGYEVFTPPEASYDLARARLHLRAVDPGASGLVPAGDTLPSATWLADLARRLPASTRLVLVFPPLHAGSQPPEGSPGEAIDAACKARLVEAVHGRGALILDYRRRSALTTEDSNFWDPLHYRLPIAARIVDDIRANLLNPRAPEDGRFRLPSPAP